MLASAEFSVAHQWGDNIPFIPLSNLNLLVKFVLTPFQLFFTERVFFEIEIYFQLGYTAIAVRASPLYRNFSLEVELLDQCLIHSSSYFARALSRSY